MIMEMIDEVSALKAQIEGKDEIIAALRQEVEHLTSRISQYEGEALPKGTKELLFEEFYDRYQKKRGRDQCWEYWKKKLKTADIEAIMDNVDDYVRANPDKKYRLDPIRYLKYRRWEDELPFKPKKQQPKTQPTQSNTWDYGK